MGTKIFLAGEADKFGNYVRAIEAAGGIPVASVDPGEAESCAGLLLPGGGDIEPWRYGRKNTASCELEPERDARELAVLQRFAAFEKPVLGVCRGLQLINVFFGGTLCQDFPGHSRYNGIDRLHAVRAVPSPIFEVCGERCVVNSSHHQRIDRVGEGLRAVQWAPDGTVEAVCHETLPIWAVQWHPERLGGKTGETLFRAFLAACES